MFLCVKALYIFPFFPNQLVFLCSTLSVQVRLASSSGSDQSWSRVQRSDWWPSILLVRHSLAASCTIFHVFMKFMSYSNAQLLVWKDVAGRLASVKLSEGIFQLPLSGICHFVTNSDRRKTPKWKGKECSFYPNMPILPCGSLNFVQQGCGSSTSVGWRNRARISINSINDTHCFIPDPMVIPYKSQRFAQNFALGLSQMLMEVRVLKSLDHPHVIRIYEAFERLGMWWIPSTCSPGY